MLEGGCVLCLTLMIFMLLKRPLPAVVQVVEETPTQVAVTAAERVVPLL